MNTRCGQILLLTLLSVFAVSSASFAQDAGMSDLEMTAEGDAMEGKESFVPGEDLRYTSQSVGLVMAKDSIVIQMHGFPIQRAGQKRAEKTSDSQNSKPKDDSILTFNFLYYIIQKYKLQDVID